MAEKLKAEEFFYTNDDRDDSIKRDADLHGPILRAVDYPIDEDIMNPIRERNRARYQAEQEAERKAARLKSQWARTKARSVQLLEKKAPWNEADHPRGQPGNAGQFGPGGGGDSSDNARREGEDDKTFAKRVIDKRPAPKELPEKHEDYFNMEGATVVPLSSLVSGKTAEENKQGGDNGAKRMAAAANGELSKRDPITVEPMGDGKYLITDGNGTFTTVQKYGWKAIPVKIDAVSGYKPGVKAAGYIDPVRDQWVKESPIKTIDDVVRAAPIAQKAFNKAGSAIAKKLGVQFIAAGPKTHTMNEKTGKLEIRPDGIARIKEKQDERSKKEGKPSPIARVTDTARGTFVLNRTADAQKVIDELSKTHEIVVENWRTIAATWYTDRALLFRDRETGLIGELQLAHPEMLRAKQSGGGHGLYEQARSLPKGDLRVINLNLKMRQLYGKVLDSLHAEWKEIDGREYFKR